jgi:hypothetical protein
MSDAGRRARWLSWRPRLAAAAVALPLGAAVAAALFAAKLYTGAASSSCEQWPAAELDMDTLKSMKARLDAYRADARPDAEMTLTGAELTALLQGEVPYSVLIQVIGDRTADVTIAAAAEEGCYNIHYRGSVAVVDGMLVLVPEALRVGDSDLGWMVSGWTWSLDPNTWLGGEGASAVGKLESLSVRDGVLALRLRDRWMVH